jgi:polysaccharide biosynthesis protein PslG
MRRQTLAALFLGVLTCASVSASPFLIGVGTSAREGVTALERARSLGFNAQREDLPWAQAEQPLGQFKLPAWVESTVDFGHARQMPTVVILAYGHPLRGVGKPLTSAQRADFARYCAEMAALLKDRAIYFEVWNEWDARTGGAPAAGADDYVELLKVVRPAILKVHPEAKLLSGGISDYSFSDGWYARFLAAGGANLVDAISLHPYTFQHRIKNGVFDSLAVVEKAIEATDRVTAPRKLPFFVTEVGWPTFEGNRGVEVDELERNYLSFMLLASSNPRIAGVWWYGLRDQGTDRTIKNQNFGLLGHSMQPKFDLSLIKRLNTSLSKSRPKLLCKSNDAASFELSPIESGGKPWRMAINPDKLASNCPKVTPETVLQANFRLLSSSPTVVLDTAP